MQSSSSREWGRGGGWEGGKSRDPPPPSLPSAVAGDNDGEHETSLQAAAGTSAADRRSLEQWVSSPSQGLRPALFDKLDALIGEYRGL